MNILLRWRRLLPLLALGAFTAAALIAWFSDIDSLLQAWLAGALFWLDIALGALAIFLLHGLTGGRWGEFIRPVLRATIITLPLAILLLLPLLAGLDVLYPWTAPVAALPEVVQHKTAYLNVAFFAGRSLLYAVLWCALTAAVLLTPVPRLKPICVAGLMIYTLSVTFFAFDWIMSLTPEWYSSTFGFLIGSGQLLAGLAFVILIQTGLADDRDDSRERLHDLGNLLLAAVMFWSYLAFMEYLIIWSGDLPHGISWYVQRGGGWSVLALFIIALHFAIPFIVLLSRRSKRSRRILAVTALMLLGGHLLDVFWLVLPAFAGGPAHTLLLVLQAALLTLAIGALWLALFSWQLQNTLARSDDPAQPVALYYG